MEALRFSMYEVILKGMNGWHGHAIGRLWHTIDAEQQRHIATHAGFHYVPQDTLNDNWHLDIEGGTFANYKASPSMRPIQDYCDDWLIFGERLFSHRYWVHSLLQFDLGVEYKGFFSKQEALRYQKQQRDSGDYFDVVLLHMRASDRYDYIPIDLHYPVQEIMEKKYFNSIRDSNPDARQSFQDFFIQYLHNLVFNNYVRCGEDDKALWWGLFKDLEDVVQVIRAEKKNYLYHLYELLNRAYDLLYDGGCADISFFK